MRTILIQKELYTFDELSGEAKGNAICQLTQDFEADYLIEDFVRIADILGIEIDTRPVKLMSGKTREDPCIYWSGFWSQGDGACFTGSYRYAKGAPKRIAEQTSDPELIRIATELQIAQRKNFYRASAHITRPLGMYCHEYSMDISVRHWDDMWRDIVGEKDIEEALRDFARWMYRRLEDEYIHQTSEEAVREMCAANEYEFDEKGALQ